MAGQDLEGGGAVGEEGESGGVYVEPMSEEVESRFLTMSWWILHVGWKDVAERVRRGVEEAFDESVFFCFLLFCVFMPVS